MSVKVCHMTSAHNSTDARIFSKECVSLAQAGYEVYLVARGVSREQDGVHVVGEGEAPAGRIKRMTEFSKRIFKAAMLLDADIYHLHDPELLQYVAPLKRRGKTVIFDSHENHSRQIIFRPYLNAPLRKIVSALYVGYEKSAVKKADAVVIPCTFLGKNPFADCARHTAFVANYPRLMPADRNVGEKSGVCYVGSVSSGRGVSQLMRGVFAAGERLKLAGPFAGEACARQLKGDSAWSCVDYEGVLSYEQTQQLISGCLAGGCTLLCEGQYAEMDTLPTKAYEYMMHSLPVILSDTPFNRVCAEKYGFGICVDPQNERETADAVTRLKSDSAAAKQMGENGRRAAETEFNWSTQEKNLLELYARLLQK